VLPCGAGLTPAARDYRMPGQAAGEDCAMPITSTNPLIKGGLPPPEYKDGCHGSS